MNAWYFTFGFSHRLNDDTPLNDRYCVIEADDRDDARDLMFALRGIGWAFQYDSAEQAGVAGFRLRQIELRRLYDDRTPLAQRDLTPEMRTASVFRLLRWRYPQMLKNQAATPRDGSGSLLIPVTPGAKPTCWAIEAYRVDETVRYRIAATVWRAEHDDAPRMRVVFDDYSADGLLERIAADSPRIQAMRDALVL